MKRSETEIVTKLTSLPNERLGQLFKDHLNGQIDDLDWEGYTKEQQEVVLMFLDDFCIAIDHSD